MRWNITHWLRNMSKSPLISVRTSEEDFHFWQVECTRNIELRFGPVVCGIDKLFWDGWEVGASGSLHTKKITVRLFHQKYKETYKLYSINLYSSHAGLPLPPTDLLEPVKDKKQMMGMGAVKSSPEKDPIEILLEKFPIKKQPLKLFGNRTMEEILS